MTIQAQVLKLMKDLRDQLKTSMLMITHDLGIIAETCDDCGGGLWRGDRGDRVGGSNL